MKINSSFKGYLFAALSAVTYGMNPLFGLRLYAEGLTPYSVLFYRFLFASFLLAGAVLARKRSFRVPKRDIPHLLLAGVFLALTCLFWFLSFKLMDSGLAATILYSYPVMVAVIMGLFFHERLTLSMLAGIGLAVAGVAILCCSGGAARVSAAGIIMILLSALAYALYIVLLKVSRLKELAPESLTMYGMIIGTAVIFLFLRCGMDLQPIPSWTAFGNCLGVAFFPSLMAFLLMAIALQYIGATKTAVLGALEPLTAVVIGILVFHEACTWSLYAGFILIAAAVLLIILGDRKKASPVETKG